MILNSREGGGIVTEIRNSSDMLLAHGISPTYQRVQVLRFLRYHMPHPRAEDIYAFMQRKRLSLSRATVYNVLALFVKHGLVREIRLATGGAALRPGPKPPRAFPVRGLRADCRRALPPVPPPPGGRFGGVFAAGAGADLQGPVPGLPVFGQAQQHA